MPGCGRNKRNTRTGFMTVVGMAFLAPPRRCAKSFSTKGIPLLQGMAFGVVERVRTSTKPHHRFAGGEVSPYMRHLRGGELPPAQKEHSQVCLCQRFQVRNVSLGILIRI